MDGVLFDKDGVIGDGQALCVALHQARRAVLVREFGERAGDFYDWVMDAGHVCTAEGAAMLASLAEAEVLMAWVIRRATALDWSEARERARQVTVAADQAVDVARVPLTRGAREILEQLKRHRVPVGLLTADGRERTGNQLRHWKIASFFDVVVTDDDVAIAKPDPAGALLAAKRLGLDPQRLVLVGDSPNDWRLAEAVGMPCVALASEAPQGFSSVLATIRDFSDVIVLPPEEGKASGANSDRR
ncbi:MAG: HAD family hydrolase [Firmicutes bacterium]|nr:HAD family hydrolase [Bacillota bacterium]